MKRSVQVVQILAAIVLSACAEAGTGSAAVATPAPDAIAADSAHYTSLFENDAARLLRVKYPAGSKSVMHSHPAGCAIILTDHTMKFTLATGDSVQPPTGQPGNIACFDGNSHLPENVGTAEVELILLELKGRATFDNIQTGRAITLPQSGAHPEAVVADPRHYAVNFENDAVRVVRAKLGPREKSVMHAHPAHCAIFITEGSGRNTTPDGTVSTETNAARSAGCGDGMTHLPENAGANPVEVVIIEFKTRQAFK